MSPTPAFSPGPWSTCGPRVGRRRRCTLLDLYEQCSLHITLKMPSSVIFGSRLRICFTRAYSSAVRPCSAAISGVTLISVGAVAICALRSKQAEQGASLRENSTVQEASSGGPRRAGQGFGHGAQNDQAIGGIEGRFHGALRVRHQARDVALAVADAGNVVERAIRIARGVICALWSCIAEQNLAILFEIGERCFIGVVVAVIVCDGNFQNLALRSGVGERCIGLLDADEYVAANVAETRIAHHGAGKQAGFEKNLKAVADA